jgi:hypothetical protein
MTISGELVGGVLEQVRPGEVSLGRTNALPEGWVTFHSGDMGYTFCLCEESKGALAGV